jgi:N-acetylneuraminate synthase
MQNKAKLISDNPLFVAEISANHLGDFERAKELVRAAILSGANAVKFQTYTAETMTLKIDNPQFRISDDHELWGGKLLYELYETAHTPWEWHEELFSICRDADVIPFSSPFDFTAVEFLETLNCPIYKIASMETGDLPLIEMVAETGKPLIISTGATTWQEIEAVVECVASTGNRDLTLMICTSSYPALPRDAHLKRMETICSSFDVKVGLSDHTLGIGVSLAAIALGASVIEKHFTLRRSDGGADGAFSMEPAEFAQLVLEGKSATESLGSPNWSIQDSESESRRLRRSLFITSDVNAGDEVTHRNVRSIRPNGGCPPAHLDTLIGKRFISNHSAGTPMDPNFVQT